MNKVPLQNKYLLTIKETVELFGIGEHRLRNIVRNNNELKFVLKVGVKYMIKRELFEEFIREVDEI